MIMFLMILSAKMYADTIRIEILICLLPLRIMLRAKNRKISRYGIKLIYENMIDVFGGWHAPILENSQLHY